MFLHQETSSALSVLSHDVLAFLAFLADAGERAAVAAEARVMVEQTQ
jgi:hypothetical protein